MSKIQKILHFQNKGDTALVNVLMEDGTEGVVWIGGDCEVYFAHGRINVFVKKAPKHLMECGGSGDASAPPITGMNELNNIDEQALRDIFNANGLNYSQIVGDELTTVSMELQDFNWSLTQILALITEQVWLGSTRDGQGQAPTTPKTSRVWAMPSIWTFKIKPIADLLKVEMANERGWADPFAGHNSPAEFTNDIEEDRPTTHHMDALEFLKTFDDNSLNGVIFDPPYSTEQCLRRYTPKHGGTAGRAEYWGKCKDEIKRIVKPGGKAISMCWDSTGIGKKRGFTIDRILLVCHGACHNDTIVTVETKLLELGVVGNTPTHSKDTTKEDV